MTTHHLHQCRVVTKDGESYGQNIKREGINNEGVINLRGIEKKQEEEKKEEKYQKGAITMDVEVIPIAIATKSYNLHIANLVECLLLLDQEMFDADNTNSPKGAA